MIFLEVSIKTKSRLRRYFKEKIMKRIGFIFIAFFLSFVVYAQEMAFPSDGVDIFGMLTLPENEEPKTICIIVPGSGPMDMDGNNVAGLKTDCYKLLAEKLQEGGIASFRYDKRSIGKSIPKNKDEVIIFDTMVNDVVSIIFGIKEMKQFEKIYLIGHSEGSLISILASKAEPVDGIISISGVGKNADELLIDQFQKQLSATIVKDAKKIIKSLKKGNIYKGDIPVLLQDLFSSVNQSYFISWFKYNPKKEISSIKIPCLILHGGSDSQVDPANSKLLKSGNKNARFKIIENMTHVLKEVKNSNEEQLTYIDSSYPIPKDLIDEILGFIKGNAK